MNAHKVISGGLVTMLTAGTAMVSTSPTQAAIPYEQKLSDVARTIHNKLSTTPWPDQSERNSYSLGEPSYVISSDYKHPELAKAHGACANFLTAMLKASYESGYYAIDSWATDSYFSANFGSETPYAEDYYDAFKANTAKHFNRVFFYGPEMNVKKGDVIAIKYNKKEGVSSGGDATGHMMIVDGPARKYERDGNPRTTEYAVPIIDMSSNPHGVASTTRGSNYPEFPDTRAVGYEEYNGVGRGTVFFQINYYGNISGHWWGVNEGTKHSVADRPVTLARPTKAP